MNENKDIDFTHIKLSTKQAAFLRQKSDGETYIYYSA
jgi:hypothetical protein